MQRNHLTLAAVVQPACARNCRLGALRRVGGALPAGAAALQNAPPRHRRTTAGRAQRGNEQSAAHRCDPTLSPSHAPGALRASDPTIGLAHRRVDDPVSSMARPPAQARRASWTVTSVGVPAWLVLPARRHEGDAFALIPEDTEDSEPAVLALLFRSRQERPGECEVRTESLQEESP